MRYEIVRLSNGYLVSFPENDRIECKLVHDIDDALDFIRPHALKNPPEYATPK